MSELPTSIRDWIGSTIKCGASQRLLFFEWNSGRARGKKAIIFSAFGYDIRGFDPEDPNSLGQLDNGWQWESDTHGVMPASPEWDDEAIRGVFSQCLRAHKSAGAPVGSKYGTIAFGPHEGEITVFPRRAARKSKDVYFYELHVARRSNSVHCVDDRLDKDDKLIGKVIRHQKFSYPLSHNATFHLQPRGKLLDLLYDVRWLICSDRMRSLIAASTNESQVFPIRLYRGRDVNEDALIPGYFAIHLYESVRCLHADDVLPPPYKGWLPTFDPSKGYRVVRSKVGDRQIFRIAYEHRRLLVSQSFRDQCERLRITGVEWLRRKSVP